LTLVLASLIPFAIPMGIYLTMGERGKDLLRGVFTWMIQHDRVLTAGTCSSSGPSSSGGGWAPCSSRIPF
jgi:hypothetical protein